jgi:hypothetical protein
MLEQSEPAADSEHVAVREDAVHKSDGRRFFKPATLVSIGAAGVSLFAVAVSIWAIVQTHKDSQTQNAIGERSELFTLSGTLLQADTSLAQTTSSATGSSPALSVVDSLHQQVLTDADEGASLIHDLNGAVTSPEAYAVGRAFFDQGIFGEAQIYFNLATQRATEPQAKVEAYTALANLDYELGDRGALATDIDSIRNAYDNTPDVTPSEMTFNEVNADLLDAQFQLNGHYCAAAHNELQSAQVLVAQLPPANNTAVNAHNQLAQELQQLGSC